jgi:hypothetical protein
VCDVSFEVHFVWLLCRPETINMSLVCKWRGSLYPSMHSVRAWMHMCVVPFTICDYGLTLLGIKNDDSIRFCVDYRILNMVMKDVFPLSLH